jgi:hypothetical protein
MRLTVAATVFALLAGISAAQEAKQFDYSFHILRPSTEKALNPRAALAYDEALHACDRANPDETARLMAAAASMQPDLIELQFQALDRCIARGEIGYGSDSIEFFDLADTIVKRMLANPLLHQEERERAQRADQLLNGTPGHGEFAAVAGERDNVLARDEKRLNTGLELMLVVQAERIQSRGMEKPELTTLNGSGPDEEQDSKPAGPLRIDPFAKLPGEITIPLPGFTSTAPGAAPAFGRGGGAAPLPSEGEAVNPFAAPPSAPTGGRGGTPSPSPGFE